MHTYIIVIVKHIVLPEPSLKPTGWGATPRRVCQTHQPEPSAEFSRGVAAKMPCCCEQLRAISLGFYSKNRSRSCEGTWRN